MNWTKGGKPRAPPPTRGWTPEGPVGRPAQAGSPAHAGMDRRRSRSRSRDMWLPRPRGDGPWRDPAQAQRWLAPPPTRGWTRTEERAPPAAHGSPAHAGMDLQHPARVRVNQGLPRPRGDGPMSRTSSRSPIMAPPPTRGWTADFHGHNMKPVGSPAHAGMDLINRIAHYALTAAAAKGARTVCAVHLEHAVAELRL